MKDKYYAPRQTITVKTRLNQEQKDCFDNQLKLADLSQAEFIRKAIFEAKIESVIKQQVSIEGFKDLISQLGKIGSNLNQIARSMNQGEYLSDELENRIIYILNDLTKLKFELLKMIGDYYGNDKAHCK